MNLCFIPEKHLRVFFWGEGSTHGHWLEWPAVAGKGAAKCCEASRKLQTTMQCPPKGPFLPRNEMTRGGPMPGVRSRHPPLLEPKRHPAGKG
eukprot:3290378-Amphidinium_carterae.1